MLKKNNIHFWTLPMLMAVGTTQPTQAALISNLSGNTHIYENVIGHAQYDYVVNFAVFDTTGGTVGNSFAIPGLSDSVLTSHGFDVQSSYLYLYQTTVIANDSVFNNIFVDEGLVSSFGDLNGSETPTAGYGFYNNGTRVGIADPNHPLDTLTTLGNLCVGGSPAQACIGGLTNPSISFSTGDVVTLTEFPLVLHAAFTPIMGQGHTSNLWGYTSDYRPSFTRIGTCNANDECFTGTVVSASVPEPTTLTLTLIGLGLAGITFGNHKKRLNNHIL